MTSLLEMPRRWDGRVVTSSDGSSIMWRAVAKRCRREDARLVLLAERASCVRGRSARRSSVLGRGHPVMLPAMSGAVKRPRVQRAFAAIVDDIRSR
jgi:hypothetical protein